VIVYRIFAAFASLLSVVYLAGWLVNQYMPSTIDSGLQIPEGEALRKDLFLLALFGLQHSLMARPFIKRWAGRSTYLLATAVVLGVIFRYWEPLPDIVWSLDLPAARILLHAVASAGALLVVWGIAALDALAFFGFRTPPGFRVAGPYQWVRHPVMLGLLMILWSTPEASQGRLLFALAMTIYIFIALPFEERGLERELGADYARYREAVAGLLPLRRWPMQ
jgi:protein-S-isoprenylcysteine O-methyltransferase Ste14